VDLANSEMWGRPNGRLTDFLNDPQWNQRLPGILAIPRSVARACGAPRSPRTAENCCARFAEEENFAGSCNPTTRSGSAELTVKKYLYFGGWWRTKMGCSLLLNPYKLAGRRCWALIADSLAEALAHDSLGPVENMRQIPVCAWGLFVDRTKGRVRRMV